jgi:hypothetical protein
MKRAVLAALLAVALPSAVAGAATSHLLAFVTGTARSQPVVWVQDAAGGGARKLGIGDVPQISPDGAFVAASRFGSHGGALALFSTTGARTRTFFNSARVTADALAWSPDSRYVAVQLSSTTEVPGRGGLAVIDTTTSRATMVARGFVYGASFEPGASDRLVYASAAKVTYTAAVNLHVVGADGSGAAQITHDGRSLNPLWTAQGIVFDRERLRGPDAAPAFQLWLMHGATRTQLTHMRIPKLVQGLVPVAASTDGERLLAEFEGQDTSYAWTVQLSPRRVHAVSVAGKQVQGYGISADGGTILVAGGAFMNPPSRGTVMSVPFGGGAATKLASGGQPSWNS